MRGCACVSVSVPVCVCAQLGSIRGKERFVEKLSKLKEVVPICYKKNNVLHPIILAF